MDIDTDGVGGNDSVDSSSGDEAMLAVGQQVLLGLSLVMLVMSIVTYVMEKQEKENPSSGKVGDTGEEEQQQEQAYLKEREGEWEEEREEEREEAHEGTKMFRPEEEDECIERDETVVCPSAFLCPSFVTLPSWQSSWREFLFGREVTKGSRSLHSRGYRDIGHSSTKTTKGTLGSYGSYYNSFNDPYLNDLQNLSISNSNRYDPAKKRLRSRSHEDGTHRNRSYNAPETGGSIPIVPLPHPNPYGGTILSLPLLPSSGSEKDKRRSVLMSPIDKSREMRRRNSLERLVTLEGNFRRLFDTPLYTPFNTPLYTPLHTPLRTPFNTLQYTS